MATKCFSLPFPSSVSSSPSFQQTPGLPVIKHLKCIMFKTRFDSLPTPMACSPVCPSVNDYFFQDVSRIGVWLLCLTKYCSYFQRLLICFIFMLKDDQNWVLASVLFLLLCMLSSVALCVPCARNQISLPLSHPQSSWFWRQWRTKSKWSLEFKVAHHGNSNHVPFRTSFLTTSLTTGGGASLPNCVLTLYAPYTFFSTW